MPGFKPQLCTWHFAKAIKKHLLKKVRTREEHICISQALHDILYFEPGAGVGDEEVAALVQDKLEQFYKDFEGYRLFFQYFRRTWHNKLKRALVEPHQKLFCARVFLLFF